MNKDLFLDYLLNGDMTVKDEVSKKIKRFVPNKSQKKIIKIILNNLIQDKKTKLIIVKGRQVGGSSLIQRMQLDFAMNFPNFNCYVQAHDQSSASRMFLENVKNVFERMEFVKDLYKASLDNVNHLYLKEYSGKLWNSEVRVGTSARSSQADFVHISEAGKIGNFGVKWKELVNGTLEAGEQAMITIIETTAEGKNLFYDWVEVQKTNPDWEILFLSWTDKELYRKTPPESDFWLEDYKQISQEYKLKRDPVTEFGLSKEQFYWYYLKAKQLGADVKQEYPLTLQEAFATSSSPFFSKMQIENTFEKIKDIKPIYIEDELKVYEKPNPQKVYFAGIDSADEGQDDYSLDIIDSSGKQVATLAGQFKQQFDSGGKETGATWNFTRKSLELLKLYNAPFLTVELNSTGNAVQRDLISAGYPVDKLWRETAKTHLKQMESLKFGWRTTTSTRPTLLTDLQHVFNTGWLQILDKESLKQFDTFIKIDGKWQAESGKHDDRVISLGLAVQSYIFATN